MLQPYRQRQVGFPAVPRPLRNVALPAAGVLASYGARALSNYVRPFLNRPNATTRTVMKNEARNAIPVKVVSKKRAKKAMPKKKRSVKAQIKDIKKQLNNLSSTLTYRFIDVFRLIAPANQASYASYQLNDNSVIESVLSQLKFFDPANPGTLITSNGATGTYNRNYQIKGRASYVFRNNYQVPVEVRIYKYKVKADTSITPLTAFNNGLSDIGGAGAGVVGTSLAVYPSDVSQIKDIWSPVATTIWHLKPGQQRRYSHGNRKSFTYDPADVDAHNLSFQKGHYAEAILVRVSGVPAHDKTTATQLGTIGGGIDFYQKVTYHVKYNSGGADLELMYIADNTDAMTAGAVVSQPVVDNQEYSTN